MDIRMQGEEIVKRIQTATEGFQQTFREGVIYTHEEMQIKNEWVKKIRKAKEDWVRWFRSIKSPNRESN